MMALDLELALSELAHTVPVGDDSFPADGMTATVRRMATHVRRRRAARHAGTSVVGAAAVAAIVVGGGALKAHVDAAGTPSTALSKRAGAECGKPFDGSGKSDPRFTSTTWTFTVQQPGSIANWSIASEVVELSQPSVKLSQAHPATAVFLLDGIVVGIADTLTDWEIMNPGVTPGPGDDYAIQLWLPLSETMNCTARAPGPITKNMLELVMLSEYRVDGDSRTALVIAPPLKGPFINEPSNFLPPPSPPETPDRNNSSSVFVVGGTDLVRGDQVEFRIGDYLAIKDTPSANVPLYYASPDGSLPNGSKPYTGPAEADITDPGSLTVTFNGTKAFEWTEAEILPPK